MRKAMFAMTFVSLVTSVTTLGVILFGAKKVHKDIQDVQEKSREGLKKMKKAILDLDI